jgi:methylisocitrate lyase
MLTRKDLYKTIDYDGFEALDATIVKTIVPEVLSQ